MTRVYRRSAFSILLCSVLVLAAGCGPTGPAGQEGKGETSAVTDTTGVGETTGMTETASIASTSKNPDTYVVVSTSDFVSQLDPSFVYDTGSGEILFNVYDTLLFLDGEAPDKFKPLLSTQVPSTENGGISADGTVYTFPIRQGVKFHAGPVMDAAGQPIPGSGELSPDDIAYSFHRGMLQDRSGGPQWLILEPLVGVSTIMDLVKATETAAGGKAPDEIAAPGDASPATLQKVCETVKAAVKVDGDNVVFTLKEPFAPFMQILVGTWGSALDKEWVSAAITDTAGTLTKKAGWDGSCDSWQNFYDPKEEDSELFNVTNGTGPFKLDRWRREEEIVLSRNDDYWNERPAHLKQVIHKFSSEWSVRFLQLQTGDADEVSIPRTNQDQVIPLVEKGVMRELKGLPTSSMGFFTVNQKVVAENNTYIGSGKLDGEGIPPDFFSDVNVRKGFSQSFDWDTFINDGLDGDAVKPRGPIPASVFGYDPDQAVYSLDVEKAAEAFKAAWGGKLWDTGFKMVLPVAAGATNMKIASELFQQTLEEMNPKFKVELREVQGTQLGEDEEGDLVPLEYSAWQEDYHDPHNWVYPLLGSQGYFGRRMDVAPDLAKQVDDLIDQARKELDRDKRKDLYFQLQQLSYDNALIIPRADPLGHVFERAWITGYNHNPAQVGAYYWDLKKSAP